MKKFLLSFFALILIQNELFAQDFFLKTFATIEYSAPVVSGSKNRDLKTNIFEKQIKDFENIAVGFNFRVHKNLGFNLNWQQSDLNSNSLRDVSISQKAHFKTNHTNFSALFYTPKVSEIIEFFFEAGVADMNTKIAYVDANGASYSNKSHQTMGLFGAGFQLTPFKKSDDAIRFSMQKYSPNLGLINSNYTTVRLGYMKAF